MGIDGRQHLEIRGCPAILDALEASGIVFAGGDSVIAERFFGPNNVTVCHRSTKHLVVSYEFRNEPVYEYLSQLLAAHPTIWLKNEYKTEDGDRGLWVARYIKGSQSIQKLEWFELMAEEIECCDDFSL